MDKNRFLPSVLNETFLGFFKHCVNFNHLEVACNWSVCS